MKLEDIALEILEDFPEHKNQPASLSGNWHIGETSREHIEMAVNVMKHLCREFNITGKQREILVAATWLHDIGQYVITTNKKVDLPHWDYYEKTGYSRCRSLMMLHGMIGANVLDLYKDRFDEDDYRQIRMLVSSHMARWNPDSPQPETFNQQLLCIADYVASKGEGIFKWND